MTRQAPARDGLRRLRRQVGHCLREARESILELRNNSMKPRALVDALRELADHTTTIEGHPSPSSRSPAGRASCSADAERAAAAHCAGVGHQRRHGMDARRTFASP